LECGGLPPLSRTHYGLRYSGRSMLRPYGILLRQNVWEKKAGASSRTPQNRGHVLGLGKQTAEGFHIRFGREAFDECEELCVIADQHTRRAAFDSLHNNFAGLCGRHTQAFLCRGSAACDFFRRHVFRHAGVVCNRSGDAAGVNDGDSDVRTHEFVAQRI